MFELSLAITKDADVMCIRETTQKLARELGCDSVVQIKLGVVAAQCAYWVLAHDQSRDLRLQVLRSEQGKWQLSLFIYLTLPNLTSSFEAWAQVQLGAVLPLVDQIEMTEAEGCGGVLLSKMLPEENHFKMTKHLDYLAQHFQPVNAEGLVGEIKVQDMLLVESLDELARLKRELVQRNEELDIRNERLQAQQREVEQKNQALVEANQEIARMNQIKSDFLSNVSHELRTPLSIIKESVLLLAEGLLGPLTSEQKRLLGSAQANVERLTRLINELLDISKIESGKVDMDLVPVAVHPFLQELKFQFQTKAEARQLSFEILSFDRNLGVLADNDRLQQIMVNLLGNAFKFTPPFGRVTINAASQQHQVVIAVQDSGPGIKAEDQERIFDKFQQVGRVHGPGEQGTGLGLSITKQLVEKMQGRIWVESFPGQGSTFFVSLPQALLPLATFSEGAGGEGFGRSTAQLLLQRLQAKEKTKI